MNEVIERILGLVDKKGVQRNCKLILKKLSFKSAKDLGNVKELALWLYIYGMYDEAIEVCDIIKDVQFTGDYSLWEVVDAALCIKARILRERGNTEESAEIISYINQYRNPDLYKNIIKWFTVTLDININSNLNNSNGRQWRLVKLMCAIKYKEAGSFPISDEDLEAVIQNLTAILQAEK